MVIQVRHALWASKDIVYESLVDASTIEGGIGGATTSGLGNMTAWGQTPRMQDSCFNLIQSMDTSGL